MSKGEHADAPPGEATATATESNPQPALQFEPHNVLLSLIAFRLVNALTIQTFFQPDEYFQALEPAWQWAFGEGAGAWITWVR
jgi:phosphatidylinositol glycan class B